MVRLSSLEPLPAFVARAEHLQYRALDHIEALGLIRVEHITGKLANSGKLTLNLDLQH